MREDRIKDAFRYIQTSEEMDEKVLSSVINRDRKGKSKNWSKIAIAAAMAIAVLTVAQIPQVSSYADGVMKTFTNIFYSGSTEVKQEGNYYDLEYAWEKERKFDSLGEFEEVWKLPLLKSPLATEESNSWSFWPSQTSKGNFFGITLTNRFYITGDLQDVKTQTTMYPTQGNEIWYEKGELYKTPVNCQILIKTICEEEITPEVDMDYCGYTRPVPDNAKSYYVKSFDTNVLITREPSDGLVAWNDDNISEITGMWFTYEGIEYHYTGDVSVETMLEIAEGLEL